MPLDYKTCRKIYIYLNKVKVAKQTLEEFVLRTHEAKTLQMAQERLQILNRFQAQMLTFLMDCGDELPYYPSERCKAVVFWFTSQKLLDASQRDAIAQKMQLADAMMRSEAIFILANASLPKHLHQVINEHIKAVEALKKENESTSNTIVA
ncbi:hypothetical protein [Maribacter sp. 2307ULW6-5]|uniref:hypothetical protein n=1 Tax=Maribacter sp. 2307ULW6-5 TaxID=3386275 RepID=UPI0039BC96D9